MIGSDVVFPKQEREMGTPLSPQRFSRITALAGNCEMISRGQSLAGKILMSKSLAASVGYTNFPKGNALGTAQRLR